MFKRSLTLAAICLSLAVLEAAPVVTQFTTSGVSRNIDVAADNNNNAVAVLIDDDEIYTTTSLSGGAWSPLQNLAPPGGSYQLPNVAMDATGTALAVWSSSTFNEVQTAYYTGGVWTTPTPQPLDTVFGNGLSVAMNGSGQGLATWITATDVRASFFSAGTWAAFDTIGSLGSFFQGSITASYSPSGNASAVWLQTDDEITNNLFVNTYDGSVWGTETNLDPDLTGPPDAGIDAFGNTIAVWSTGTGVNDIVSSHFDGFSWSAPETLSAASGNGTSPKIAVDSDGTAIAVWVDSSNELQMIQFNGFAWGVAQSIASGLINPDISQPNITMNANGDALIGWVSGNTLYNARLPKNGVVGPPILIAEETGDAIGMINLALSSNYGFDVWFEIFTEDTNTFGSSNVFIALPVPFVPLDCYPFKSATGELLVAEPWLISPLKFGYNTNTYSAITNTTGVATITYDVGLAILESIGAGTATIASGIRAYAEPGQGVSCVFAATFYDTGVDTSKIAGIGNETDGFFFAWIQGEFGIVHRNNSVDTFIAQIDWNVDTMDGTGPSGVVLDINLGNVYKIQYLRLEFGNINFYIESAETGQFILVNQIQYTNNNTTPSLTNPGLQLMAQLISDAGENYMEVSSMGLYTEGIFNPHLGIRNNVSDNNSIGTTLVSTLSIRNDSVFSSITNQLMVFPDLLSIFNTSVNSVDAIFSLYLNPVSDIPPVFFQVNSNSCVSFSIDVSTFSGGTFIGSFGLSSGSSKSIRIKDYDIQLSPGDVLVIGCTTLTDTGTMYASISWLEQF